MQVALQLSEIPFDKNSVVTVGSFDGVHRAHQAVLKEVVDRASRRRGRSVAVTFEPHPKEVISKQPDDVRLLTSAEEKRGYCAELGLDWLLVLPFTYEFSRQGARDFFLRYLVEGTGVSEIVEGYDHHFGRDREGSVEELVKLGKEFEFSVVAMKPVYAGGDVVSSSKIRSLLLDGDVERANELLGRSYLLSGTVVKGAGRGKTLGFPTANISLSFSKKVVPRNGIYFVQVEVEEQPHSGLVSIGVRPTFEKDGERIIEAYLLDFDRSLYGKTIRLSFLKRLRDELKFDSGEELIAQMKADREQAQSLRMEFQKVHKLSKSH